MEKLNIKAIVGKNLMIARKNANLSQEEFASRIGTSQKHLSQIETGQAFVSAQLLEAISAELKIAPSLLFYSAKNAFFDDSDFGKIDEAVNAASKMLKFQIREILCADAPPPIKSLSLD